LTYTLSGAHLATCLRLGSINTGNSGLDGAFPTTYDGERTIDPTSKLPKKLPWKAESYNHLIMEQPAIF
jgi:hypothetical protein